MKYTHNEIVSIKNHALIQFDCSPAVLMHARDKRSVIKKQKRVEKIVDAFFKEVSSRSFISASEAVNTIGPTLSWILWFFARKLVTAVIIWLYENYYN